MKLKKWVLNTYIYPADTWHQRRGEMVQYKGMLYRILFEAVRDDQLVNNIPEKVIRYIKRYRIYKE